MARKNNQDEDPSEEDVSNNNDDTFGLPEIEYEPLNRDGSSRATEPVSEASSQPNQTSREMEREGFQTSEYNTNYYEEEEPNSPWPKILGIGALLLIVAAGAWYFGVYRPDQAKLADKAKQEQQAADAAKRRQAELDEHRRLEDERRIADSLASIKQPAAGTVATLNERTGRYYVIIASGVDGDLILDYANKLAPKGLSPKIIPPHGKVKFYRLAIEEGNTFASTQARADELKAEYTEGAWVVKY